MSILTIGPEEIKRRKQKSDYINDTDELTFQSKSNGSRAAAYKASRELKDQREIEKLCDDSNYWEDLIDE